MVDVPRAPPTVERQKEYNTNHGVGMALYPNPGHFRDYEPMPQLASKIEWCKKSLRWRSKRTRRYVNPHLISSE